MRRIVPHVLALLVVSALASVASAQTNAETRAALAGFPESQAVLYINTKRLINDAMPRVMPKVEYQKMIDEAKKVGFDARGLEHAVVGIRFAPGAPAGAMPEFVALVRGSFNADSLLTLARMGIGDSAKFREEAHGSKSIIIFEMPKKSEFDDKSAGGEPGAEGTNAQEPKPADTSAFSVSEVAVVALDANTLVAGIPSYVKAAIDSATGQGGLKASTIELASRDPNSLISFTADLPPNIPDYLKQAGMETNDEVRRVLGWLKTFSFSVGMDALNFTSKASVLTDAPEHAGALDGMLQLALTAAEAALRAEVAKKGKDVAQSRSALAALQSVTHTVEGSTLDVGSHVPQATVAEMVRKEMAKGQKPAPRRPAAQRRARTRRK